MEKSSIIKEMKISKEMFMRELKVNGVYKHFKGNYYLVVDVALHSETKEKYVHYWISRFDFFFWRTSVNNFI